MNIYHISMTFSIHHSHMFKLTAKAPYAFPRFGLCDLISILGCTANGHNISDYISPLSNVLWGSLDIENR